MPELALLGDVSLNAGLALLRPGDWRLLPENLLHRANQADLLVFNLESPVKGPRENLGKTPRLHTTAAALRALPQGKNTVAVLANNHAGDCLAQGLKNTLGALDRMGIRHVGAGLSPEQAREPLYLQVNGVKVGIAAFCDPSTNPCLPEDAGVWINMLDADRAIAQTREMKKNADLVAIYLHWGVDFFSFPAPAQVCLARDLVRAGAGLVAGTHAHVVQGWESRDSSLVFYGLGNTCFGPCKEISFHSGNRTSLAVFAGFDSKGFPGQPQIHVLRRNVDSRDVEELPENQARFLRRLSRPLGRGDRQYASFFKRALLLHQAWGHPLEILGSDALTLRQKARRLSPARAGGYALRLGKQVLSQIQRKAP